MRTLTKSRSYLLKLTTSMLALAGFAAQATAATTLLRAADLTNMVGVNVHMEYTDGGYANVPNVISDLKFLGISNLRDGALNPSNQGQSSYDAVAAAGNKFDFVFMQGDNLPNTFALTNAFLGRHPGSVLSIEGANEVNNWPVNYNGLTGTPGAQAFQKATYTMSHANAATSTLPVYNFTDWPCYYGASDAGTVHSYPANGNQPYTRFVSDIACQANVMPAGTPEVITEAGYYTLPGTIGWGGVNQREQSKMTLNMIMDAAYLGVQKIYLYQLLDAYQDPTNSDMEKHFGLFDINNQPKGVAHSLHAFMAALQDTGAIATTFTPTPITYSIAGTNSWAVSALKTTVKSLQLEKSSGIHDIVIWDETPVWNNTTHADIFGGDYPMTVTLDKVHALVKVYDPHVSPNPVSTLTNVSKVPVAVAGRPIIVEVSAN